jgi:cyclase
MIIPLENINQRRNGRAIARLDVKNNRLVKTIQLEGLRSVGDPLDYARKYYENGIDELMIFDVVASLYRRPSVLESVRSIVENVFIPVTVGGGLASLSDVESAFMSGADKIAVNTAAVLYPSFIDTLVRRFGSQAIVGSISAKSTSDREWEVLTHGARNKTGLSVIEWADELSKRGVGEILVTSVDREGTRKGFDLRLLEKICRVIGDVPLIIGGGCGSVRDIKEAVDAGADAISVAGVLHYNLISVREARAAVR